MSSVDGQIPHIYLTPEKGAELLENLPIFAGFNHNELIRVYSLGELRLYQASSNIIIEGENSVGMYLILEGQVGVYKAGRGAADDGHLLTHLGPGASFGELSFIDHQPRSATVVAQTKVLTYYLDGDVWQKVLDSHSHVAHRFYKNFAHSLSNRIRVLDEQFIMSQKQLWKYALTRGSGS